jgi:hypothetical protein
MDDESGPAFGTECLISGTHHGANIVGKIIFSEAGGYASAGTYRMMSMEHEIVPQVVRSDMPELSAVRAFGLQSKFSKHVGAIPSCVFFRILVDRCSFFFGDMDENSLSANFFCQCGHCPSLRSFAYIYLI